MEKQITTSWYMVLIKGIIMILLALMVLSSPGDALLAFALYIGIGLLLTGVIMAIRGFSLKKVSSNWGWIVFEGFFDIFLGYILLANPLVTAEVLPWLFGFWAVFYGILLIIKSFSDKDNRIVKILSGILIIIIGNTVMQNPIFAGVSFAIWAAILLLVVGIYNVIASFSLKK